MSEIVKSTGTYKVKDTGEEISYDFEYPIISSVQDAIDSIGEDKCKGLIQRMLKVDSNNVAREKAKSVNGHSTRKVMSEEEKAENKSQRASDKNILALLKEKGLNLEDIQGL